MTHPAGPQLEYAAPPPALARRRVKRAIWIVLVVAVVGGVFAFAYPRIERRWEWLRVQGNWMTLSRTAGQVAYSEQWTTVPGGFSRSAGQSFDSADERMRGPFGLPRVPDGATLFVHGRTPAGGGAARLVVVELHRAPGSVTRVGDPAGAVTVHWYAGTPGGWFADPSSLASGKVDFIRPTAPATGETTFLNGQPDATDAARFTIPYRIDGVAGVIDGTLRADGGVVLTASSGPLAGRVVTTLPAKQ